MDTPTNDTPQRPRTHRPRVIYHQSLRQLARLKERWSNALTKGNRAEAIARIDQRIAARQGLNLRCALPKKQQRKLGLLPPIIQHIPITPPNPEVTRIFEALKGCAQ